MASSQLTVSCSRGVIRVYGGNRGDVRSMYSYYKNMTLENFLQKHPFLLESDFATLKLSKRFNKR